jgi:hypothetical protein
MIESFWARMQVELLDRQKWSSIVELAAATVDYVDTFHNKKRRHSALDMLTPTEYENLHPPRHSLCEPGQQTGVKSFGPKKMGSCHKPPSEIYELSK